MHGDFSRRTFDSADGYRAVLFQQGRVMLDADWNEQTDITAHHDEVRTADIVGPGGGPATSGPGPFAITAADGSVPGATAWADLRVAGGTYYVDGILCEADPAGRWPLTDQPHLPQVGSSPGLSEPAADRVALYLDVWARQVTAEEDPALLEVALGGPDTTTRAQTVWQVRAEPVDPGVTCVDVHDPGWLHRTPRPMAAGLQPAGSTADPCEISGTGGYQRLSNQLYRVQIHDDGSAGPATFVWSRDNGSVFAGLTGIDDATASTATLGLDRVGRDDQSSFADGDLVEVTSTDLELRGLRGFLARAGTPVVVADSAGAAAAVTLPVEWLDSAHRPADLTALGRAPIVRRWDGGPLPLRVGATELEAGITVRFPNSGTPATGDHWLIPARTVRMAYGLAQQSGTIEWPPGGRGPDEQRPVGPVHHIAPLGVLERAGAGWSLASDCRTLFPPLTAMVTIDLVGGDGQEAMPGRPLPEPVRVVVRNGRLPVVGAPVRFTSAGGHLADTGLPTAGSPPSVTVTTGPDGVADVRWLLDPNGSSTQALTVRRLDGSGDPVDAAVVVTGRLSVARQVQWDPPRGCDRFAATTTVQQALVGLVTTRQLRLLGGDGQEVAEAGRCVPQPVRVVLDSPCGPLAKAEVVALDEAGLVAVADAGQPTPGTLTGADVKAVFVTGADGVAAFWWQPGFGGDGSATLDIMVDGGDAPIRVTAQLDPPGSRRPGLHITDLGFGTGKPFRNDTDVHPDELASGIVVDLDGELDPDSVAGKPVARVELELPWPVHSDGDAWAPVPIGYHNVTLAADLAAERERLLWTPRGRTEGWLRDGLWSALADAHWDEPLLGRFIVEGWALISAKDRDLHVNGHALTRMRGTRTLFALPTDDEITGGVFTQWFRLTRAPLRPQRKPVPDLVRRTGAVAERLLAAEGLPLAGTVVERDDRIRKGLVLRTEPAAGTVVDEGTPITLVVSAGR
ncbi:MAG: DUF6519 domain-containing protein [Candidatus Nanopelagicales bacterium]